MTQQFPLITAHTGCMNILDNTLLSVETAIRLGADVIEEDVRVTKDGVLVMAHDDVWHTVDGLECRISEMTYEEISELQLGVPRGERIEEMRICRLEEMMPFIQASGKIANLDLKVAESIKSVAALVKKYDLLEQVILSGCEREWALKAQLEHPELRKLLNADHSLFQMMAYADAAEQTFRDAVAASCIGINFNYRVVSQALLDRAADYNMPIYVWTVNDESLMEQLARMGVASITSRNVEALVSLKQRMQG